MTVRHVPQERDISHFDAVLPAAPVATTGIHRRRPPLTSLKVNAKLAGIGFTQRALAGEMG
jgi:hypothetical protein